MSEELKSCPFCGNHAVSEVLRPHFGKGTIAIECNNCKTRGPETRFESFDDKYTAQHRTAWNTRPDSNTYKYAEHSDWWAVFGKIFDFDEEEEESSRAFFNAARELKEKP